MIDFAFVAGGRLHVSLGGAAPRALESAYADSVRDRAHDIHRRHSWKGEGSQGGFGAIYAVFQYLNFFSARYTGKPLTTAGGPKGRPGDLRRMLQWANLVDAQREGPADEDAGGATHGHRLLRQRTGPAEALASGVACYDLAADGSILYATGSAIVRLGVDGRTEKLCDARAVDAIVAL